MSVCVGLQFIASGQVIIHEGRHSDFAFFIEKGQFEVYRLTKNGNKEVLNVLKTNDYFGEIGLLFGRPRIASVKALETSKVRIFDKNHLITFIKKEPNGVQQIMKNCSKRLGRSVNLKNFEFKK